MKLSGVLPPDPESDYMRVTKEYAERSMQPPDVMTVVVPGGERVTLMKGDRLSLAIHHQTPGSDASGYTLRINAPAPRVSLLARVRRWLRSAWGAR